MYWFFVGMLILVFAPDIGFIYFYRTVRPTLSGKPLLSDFLIREQVGDLYP